MELLRNNKAKEILRKERPFINLSTKKILNEIHIIINVFSEPNDKTIELVDRLEKELILRN